MAPRNPGNKQAFILSEEDARKLREMYDYVKKQRLNSPHQEPPLYDSAVPEVYVAKVPESGIPAREEMFPGCAYCSIYKLVDTGGGAGNCEVPKVLSAVILPGGAFSQLVYNISLSPILPEEDPENPGEYLDLFIPIIREKYGRWIPTCCGETPPTTGTGSTGTGSTGTGSTGTGSTGTGSTGTGSTGTGTGTEPTGTGTGTSTSTSTSPPCTTVLRDITIECVDGEIVVTKEYCDIA